MWLILALAAHGAASAAGAAVLESCPGDSDPDDHEVCSALQLSRGRVATALGSGQQSDEYPAWQVCSYAGTSTRHLCGYKVKFVGNYYKTQYRWMYSNVSFGEEDGTDVYLQQDGILMSTRVTIDGEGFVTSSEQWDFFQVPDIEPLKGWRVEGLPAGTYNVNACPITYGDATCSPARALPQRSDNSTFKIILDTDIGVFMDDPLALAFAALHDSLDLQMVMTTSRNTTQSAYIAAKLLWTVGRSDVEVNAGFSQAPEDDQLMTDWSLQPPSDSNLNSSEWLDELSSMVKSPEINNLTTPLRAKALIRDLSRRGAISPEQPLIYWLTGPADSQAQVQALLTAEEKACVFVVAMGGSIVAGFPSGRHHHRPSAPPAAMQSPGRDRAVSLLGRTSRNRLPFGEESGFSPWPETNVKGEDSIYGNGTGVQNWKSMVQDPNWAALLLSTSEPVCDSQPGGDNGTTLVWEQFKASEASGAIALMDMLYAWTDAAAEQCTGDNADLNKCAPADEAADIAASNFSYAPAQCDVTSIMPWLYPARFGIESMYLDFSTDEDDEVRGCTLQVEKPAGGRCVSVATYYAPPKKQPIDRKDVTYEEGSQSRDGLITAFLSTIAS